MSRGSVRNNFVIRTAVTINRTGRAIAGHLNLNPNEVDVSPEAHEGQLGIVLHELTHVMGFSFGKFGNFHVESPRSVCSHFKYLLMLIIYLQRQGYEYVTTKALAHNQTDSIQSEVVLKGKFD